jgi:1,4-alpha-glucan branching enzyme
MAGKSYSKTGKVCRVTFRLPPEVQASTAAVVGDFNGWDPSAHPMKQTAEGGFWVTVSLDSGTKYRYRFLLDGTRWENERDADEYAPNNFGTQDSVIVV